MPKNVRVFPIEIEFELIVYVFIVLSYSQDKRNPGNTAATGRRWTPGWRPFVTVRAIQSRQYNSLPLRIYAAKILTLQRDSVEILDGPRAEPRAGLCPQYLHISEATLLDLPLKVLEMWNKGATDIPNYQRGSYTFSRSDEINV